MPDAQGYWVVVCDVFGSPLPIRDRSLAYIFQHKGDRAQVIVRAKGNRTRYIRPWVSIRHLHNFRPLFIGPEHEEYEWKYDARCVDETHAHDMVVWLVAARAEFESAKKKFEEKLSGMSDDEMILRFAGKSKPTGD